MEIICTQEPKSSLWDTDCLLLLKGTWPAQRVSSSGSQAFLIIPVFPSNPATYFSFFLLEKLLKDEGFLHCFHLNVPSKQDLLSFFCILITTRVFLRAHIACSDSSVGERQMSAESRCLWSQIQYSELPLNVSSFQSQQSALRKSETASLQSLNVWHDVRFHQRVH